MEGNTTTISHIYPYYLPQILSSYFWGKVKSPGQKKKTHIQLFFYSLNQKFKIMLEI